MSVYPLTIELDIAHNHGALFEYVIKQNYDIITFVNEFMRSEFCRRTWDSEYSVLQLWDACFTISEYLHEGYVIPKTDTPFEDIDMMFWIGYIYRLCVLRLEISSAKLIDCVPLEMLMNGYYGLHTLDPLRVCDDIKKYHLQGE